MERWFGVDEGSADPAVENEWSNLPFMALSDGAHRLATPQVPWVQARTLRGLRGMASRGATTMPVTCRGCPFPVLVQ